MGLLDKMKAGVDQAKTMAEVGVAKAKDEAKELQLKRELSQAFAELGKAAFEQLESGALTAAALDAGAERIRSLRAELAALGADDSPPAE
jgi:hypothetical protein